MKSLSVVASIVLVFIAIHVHAQSSSKYILGGMGKTCADACFDLGMNCNPEIETQNSSAIFALVGAKCSSYGTKPWWRSDQPSMNSSGACLGFIGVPQAVVCQGRFPITQRVCKCDKPARTDLPFGTGYSQGIISMEELTIFGYHGPKMPQYSYQHQMNHFWMTPTRSDVIIRYYVDNETTPSIAFRPYLACGAGFNDQTAPWGTKWFGKGAKTGAWFWNFKVPFTNNVRVTAQSNVTDVLYIIVRGVQRALINIGFFDVGAGAKLIQFHTDKVFQPLDFVPVAEVPVGKKGIFFMHTLAVQSTNLNFLEGCYHAYSPPNASWPGTIMSTGTEDYFDSAYYFDGGQFHLPVSGFTHYTQASGNVTFSAYRFHEMDPFPFDNGLLFQWRVGDMTDPSGIKCLIKSGGATNGHPGASRVIIDAWVYVWD